MTSLKVSLASATAILKLIAPESALVTNAPKSSQQYAGFKLVCFKQTGRWVLLPKDDVVPPTLLINTLGCEREAIEELISVGLAEQTLLYLRCPESRDWPIARKSIDKCSVCCIPFPEKMLVFYIDVKNKNAISLVKFATSRSVLLGMEQEAKISRWLFDSRIFAAPELLAVGNISRSSSKQPMPFFHYQYIDGTNNTNRDPDTVIRFLHTLKLANRQLSATDIAARLLDRIDALNLSRRSARRLVELLGRIDDKTQHSASLLHGDFRNRNLLVEKSTRRLVALDWEFSGKAGWGVFDFIRHVLDDTYNNRAVDSLSAMYEPAHIELIKKNLPKFFDSAPPALPVLLTLQFCQHFIDRVDGFLGVSGENMERLNLLLNSENIFDYLVANIS